MMSCRRCSEKTLRTLSFTEARRQLSCILCENSGQMNSFFALKCGGIGRFSFFSMPWWAVLLAVFVWAPAAFVWLLFLVFLCCFCFCSRGKMRISDRGMCMSSQRLCLVWVATSCRLYSFQKMKFLLCLRICFSFVTRTEPLSAIGQTPREKKLRTCVVRRSLT